eukprot:UN31076
MSIQSADVIISDKMSIQSGALGKKEVKYDKKSTLFCIRTLYGNSGNVQLESLKTFFVIIYIWAWICFIFRMITQ